MVIDRSTHSIELERNFDASPAQVFDAWTQPEHIACWWDPAGAALAVCEIDLKPGGTFRFVPQNHPDMPFAGTYLEIVPSERIVFEAMGAVGRVLIDAVGGRTRLKVQIQCRSAAHLEQFLQSGVDKGTAQTLDNLSTYLA